MSIFQSLGSIRRKLKHLKLPRFLLLVISTLAVIQFLIVPAFTQQPVTINMLMQALEAAQWQPIVKKFNDSHDDIKLRLVEGPNTTNQVEDLYTSSFLLGNSPYDLVYMDIVWTPKFAAAGWLRELSEDYITQEELDKFIEGDVEGGRYEGGLYRIPFRSDVGMLYYREDLLQEEGYEPPETFAELKNIADEIQQEREDVTWGYLWQGRQYEGLSAMFVEILEGQGGFWVDPETQEVGLDKPEAVDAIEFLRGTIEQGISPYGVTTYAEEETRRIFQNGNAVFLRNWPYVAGLISEPDSPIQGKFAIKTMVHEPQEDSGACQGGWGIGMSKSTDHPEEAWEVIKFITSEEIQREFILDTGYVPSLRSLFSDERLLEKYDYLSEILDVIENSTLRPPIAQYAQTSDILQRYLSAALTDQMSSEEAMNAAARETRALLKR